MSTAMNQTYMLQEAAAAATVATAASYEAESAECFSRGSSCGGGVPLPAPIPQTPSPFSFDPVRVPARKSSTGAIHLWPASIPEEPADDLTFSTGHLSEAESGVLQLLLHLPKQQQQQQQQQQNIQRQLQQKMQHLKLQLPDPVEAQQKPRPPAAAADRGTAKEPATMAKHCPWQHVPHLCCAGACTAPHPAPAVLPCLSPSSCCSP
jgi:hypothetical protein